MINRTYFVFALLLAAFICMGTTCNYKCGDRLIIDYTYQFSEKIDLYPAKKMYKIGDTIWLQFNRPDKLLYDKVSNKKILVDTASIGFQFGFLTPDYFYPNYPINGLCNYLIFSNGTLIDSINNSCNGLYRTFGCNSTNTYDFKIGIILKQAGLFEIWLAGIERLVSGCANRINNFPLSIIGFTFNLADCNKSIFVSLPQATKGFFSGQEIDNRQAFLFYVQ